MQKSNDKEKVLLSLKKAHSHIQKIMAMVEDEKYCINIIQQINAVIGYLNSAKSKQLEQHLQSCFANGMKTTDKSKKTKLIAEVIQATKMTN